MAKLESQDGGIRTRGKKLSDGGACARFYHAVIEARLAKIIRVDLKGELFSYQIDDRAKTAAERMDGKIEELCLETPERLERCIAVYLIVAWRLHYLTQIARSMAQAPCSAAFSDQEGRRSTCCR